VSWCFPVGPRHLFDGHAAAGTVNPPHHVEEEHAQALERDELEAARHQPVVHGAGLRAPGTPRPMAAMWRDGHRHGKATDLILELDRQSLTHQGHARLNTRRIADYRSFGQK
jgi:hypothetical protein